MKKFPKEKVSFLEDLAKQPFERFCSLIRKLEDYNDKTLLVECLSTYFEDREKFWYLLKHTEDLVNLSKIDGYKLQELYRYALNTNHERVHFRKTQTVKIAKRFFLMF